MSSITHKVPNHWVEKDAKNRASHPNVRSKAHRREATWNISSPLSECS